MLNCVPSALKSPALQKVLYCLFQCQKSAVNRCLTSNLVGELAPFQGVITHRYLEYDLVLLNYDILIELDMVL